MLKSSGVGEARMDRQHGVHTTELAAGRAIGLSWLGALFPLLPLPFSAAPLCPDSFSTADQTRCLIKALAASDRQLRP